MTRLEEVCARLYREHDYNCAETVLHAAAEVYGLDLTRDAYKAIGGFGGGCGCGHLCGAVAGGCAAIGCLRIKTVAHQSDAGELCAELLTRFEKETGSVLCRDLRPRLFTDKARCEATILAGARALDSIVGRL